MAKSRILVVEDDPIHAARADMLLEKLGHELVGIASGSEDAIKLYIATKPELVLMDIQLTDKKDGIEVAEKINSINPIPVIFTTSLTDEQTFQRAKGTEPYAYLTKPLNQQELKRSIELAISNFAKSTLREDIESDYFSGWSQNAVGQDSFFIKTSQEYRKVRYADILWVEVAADRYCNIKTEQETYQIRASLRNLEQKLSPYQFIRVHKSYIANSVKID